MPKKTKRKPGILKQSMYFVIFMLFASFFYALKLLPAITYPVISSLAGLTAFYGMTGTRKLIIKNLDTAYGKSMSSISKKKVCRSVFTYMVLTLCETVQISKITTEQLLRNTVIDGEEKLAEALDMQRGVIGVCAHIGNFPRLQAVLAKKGYPVNALARDPSGTHLARFIRYQIQGEKVPLISRLNVKKAIADARNWVGSHRGILCFYIDQHAGNGVETVFFGQKVLSPTGAATFARKYNAPVLGLFSYRMACGKHKIIIEGPYSIQRTENPGEDIKNNTAMFMKRVEHYVREHPEQWFSWLHRRFR